MKSFIAIASSLLLCSCADMYITHTDVATSCDTAAGIDAKDYGSRIHYTTCAVGAHDPRAIYIRPFCIDNSVFQGDVATSDGEMPIRKALTPVELAQDLKEELERIAPARILKAGERPRLGWLVEGTFTAVDGGSPGARLFTPAAVFGAGRSFLALHVRVTDVEKGCVVYEFDMAGGSGSQGHYGTLRASGMGEAMHFDLRNAAERIYLALTPNPQRFAQRSSPALQ